ETDKDAGVQAIGKSRRSKDDVIGSFTFKAGEGIRERLECNERLDASPADDSASAIFGVVGWETKILDQPTEIGWSDEIQFVGADRFIRIYKTINAVILKIEVAGGGVEGEASRIAQAGGNLGKIRCRDIGAMVFEGEHVKGVTVQSTRGTWNVAVG